jgi:hypothetical protein
VGKSQKAKGMTSKYSLNYATDVSIISYTYNVKQNDELKGEKSSTEIVTDK